METMGAGGGSIAMLRDGCLQVGPDSAGALPGPACYDLGGMDATITDACLVLGYLDPFYFMGGDRILNVERAMEAIGNLSSSLGERPQDTSLKMIRILERNVASVLSKKKEGHEFSDWSIFAFGGNGGIHAASIADMTGIRKVFTFPFGSVFSAFGSSTLDVVHIYETSLAGKWEIRNGRLILGEWFHDLVFRAKKDMKGEGFGVGDIRYQLQLEVAREGNDKELIIFDVKEDQRDILLAGSFHRSFAVDVARLRAMVELEGRRPMKYRAPGSSLKKAMKGIRPVYWNGSPLDTPIYQMEEIPCAGPIKGPSIIESRETTVLVPHEWAFNVDIDGNVILERSSS